jgi:aminoglycoside/choline kinase family phosphotransferase
VSLPTGPADLDATWIRRALADDAESRAGEIRSVRAEVIGVGYGLDGTVARVTTAQTSGRVATLVAKWCRAEAGAREARFLREVAPHLGIDVPRLRAAFVEADRALLLLEDVAPSRQGDALVGATPAEARRLVDVAACFHARCWEPAGAHPAAWLPRWGADAAGIAEKTRVLLPRFLERWGSALTPDVLREAERLPEALPGAYERLSRAPATAIHGDFHLDNVLFRPGGAPVVIDWAFAALGPGAVDVVRLLVEGMTYEARRTEEGALVDEYLRGLSVRGIRYEAADLEADVDDALTVAFSGAVRFKEPGPGTPARLGPVVENLARNVAAMVHDRRDRRPPRRGSRA